MACAFASASRSARSAGDSPSTPSSGTPGGIASNASRSRASSSRRYGDVEARISGGKITGNNGLAPNPIFDLGTVATYYTRPMSPPWSRPLEVDRLADGGADVDFVVPLAELSGLRSNPARVAREPRERGRQRARARALRARGERRGRAAGHERGGDARVPAVHEADAAARRHASTGRPHRR